MCRLPRRLLSAVDPRVWRRDGGLARPHTTLAATLLAALVAGLPLGAGAGVSPELRMTVEHYTWEEGAETAAFFALATVENVTAVPCAHEVVLVGTDRDGAVVFQEGLGTVTLRRFEILEIEMAAEVPVDVARRTQRIEFLTRSDCELRYREPQREGEAPWRELRKTIREVYAEQRQLWQEKYALLGELRVAREAGDTGRVAALQERVAALEQRIRDNDRRRVQMGDE